MGRGLPVGGCWWYFAGGRLFVVGCLRDIAWGMLVGMDGNVKIAGFCELICGAQKGCTPTLLSLQYRKKTGAVDEGYFALSPPVSEVRFLPSEPV